MQFSTVLFDLDGTLVNTNHLIVHSFQHVLRQELNLEVPAEELYAYFGEPLPLTMARWSPERALELTDLYRIFNMEQHDLLIRRFDGVNEAVSDLFKAGVRLGVVTSKRVDAARKGLQACDLERYFETVVGMDETERHKPHPDPALLALRRLGVPPGSNVLMVGDSKFDMLCGKSAGLQTAAVGWTVQSRESLAETKPDFWIDDPRQLVSLALGK